MAAAERPHGAFSRQLFLDVSLDPTGSKPWRRINSFELAVSAPSVAKADARLSPELQRNATRRGWAEDCREAVG